MTTDTRYVRTMFPFCQITNKLEVSVDGYDKWCKGALAQNAFPELSANNRELLITGICDECFPSDPGD